MKHSDCSECEVCCSGSKLQTRWIRCGLFQIVHIIFHSNSFENLIWCNCLEFCCTSLTLLVAYTVTYLKLLIFIKIFLYHNEYSRYNRPVLVNFSKFRFISQNFKVIFHSSWKCNYKAVFIAYFQVYFFWFHTEARIKFIIL